MHPQSFSKKKNEMRREKRRGGKTSRVELPLLTDVNKASHKLSAKRAERQQQHQQQTEAATCCNLWQVVATLSGMLRFVVVLTYAMARTKKFTLHLDGCDKALQDDDDDAAGDDVDEAAAARHVGRAWHAGGGGEGGRSICHY